MSATVVRKIALVACIGAVCAVLAGEAVVRVRESGRRPVPGSIPLRYQKRSRQGYALERGVDYGEWIHINRLGFRGAEVDTSKPPGITRIVAVGASATFDACSGHDAESWPARLEHWLNATGGARRYQVINAGVPGYLMLDNILRLHTELGALHPDIIVIYAGHGTISPDDLRALRGGDSEELNAPATEGWLSEHSVLYRKVSARLRRGFIRDASSLPRPADPLWDAAIDRAGAEFERDLTSFVQIARGLGARVVVVELAHMSNKGQPRSLSAHEDSVWRAAFPAPAEVVIKGYRRFSGAQQSVANRFGALFVSPATFPLAGESDFCRGDPIHYSTSGSDVMGKALAQHLESTGLITGKASPSRRADAPKAAAQRAPLQPR